MKRPFGGGDEQEVEHQDHHGNFVDTPDEDRYRLCWAATPSDCDSAPAGSPVPRADADDEVGGETTTSSHEDVVLKESDAIDFEESDAVLYHLVITDERSYDKAIIQYLMRFPSSAQEEGRNLRGQAGKNLRTNEDELRVENQHDEDVEDVEITEDDRLLRLMSEDDRKIYSRYPSRVLRMQKLQCLLRSGVLSKVALREMLYDQVYLEGIMTEEENRDDSTSDDDELVELPPIPAQFTDAVRWCFPGKWELWSTWNFHYERHWDLVQLILELPEAERQKHAKQSGQQMFEKRELQVLAMNVLKHVLLSHDPEWIPVGHDLRGDLFGRPARAGLGGQQQADGAGQHGPAGNFGLFGPPPPPEDPLVAPTTRRTLVTLRDDLPEKYKRILIPKILVPALELAKEANFPLASSSDGFLPFFADQAASVFISEFNLRFPKELDELCWRGFFRALSAPERETFLNRLFAGPRERYRNIDHPDGARMAGPLFGTGGSIPARWFRIVSDCAARPYVLPERPAQRPRAPDPLRTDFRVPRPMPVRAERQADVEARGRFAGRLAGGRGNEGGGDENNQAGEDRFTFTHVLGFMLAGALIFFSALFYILTAMMQEVVKAGTEKWKNVISTAVELKTTAVKTLTDFPRAALKKVLKFSRLCCGSLAEKGFRMMERRVGKKTKGV
ncbi:unnamed protein product [Amoebophrya sp. A120]|nr:unnamed protein product [Amoebophrya sp. A120]|eukprot:GSA120T00020954001.1